MVQQKNIDKSLKSWIWDAACSIRGAKADHKLVRFHHHLVPDDPEQPFWSVIRKLSDKIDEGVIIHMRAIARGNRSCRASSTAPAQVRSVSIPIVENKESNYERS